MVQKQQENQHKSNKNENVSVARSKQELRKTVGDTKKAVEIHVISNTHCDKEYVFSGPRTRAIVVRTLDELLRIFREVPAYRHFHLDGQTSPLMTYLSVKPEKKDELVQAVKSGKLLVGPWHTLTDMLQISGEAIIRNLLCGHREAKEFGGVMKAGYNIFGWGQISQLPQIYRGFDIDNIMFYRGINEQVSPKLEFTWRSPDGSEVLGLRYGEGYRLNFFHFVYLPVVFGRCHWGCPPYDWKDTNGVMFHVCDEYSQDPNSFLLKTKQGLDIEKIPEGIERLLKTFEGTATTPYCMASMGWDDGMPYSELPKLIDKINEYLGDRATVIQSSLPEYIEMLRSGIDFDKLDVLTGEMRHENKLVKNGDTRPPLYAGVFSARIPINLENTDVELRLEKWAEPASVFAWMYGREYFSAAFDEAWEGLFTNQSHDCIGGTHTDTVYNSIMERYSQAREIAETETYQSLQHISQLIDTSDIGEDDSVLVVFNSLPYERSEIIHAHIDTPTEEHYKSFVIEDDNGEIILPQANYNFDTIVYLHQVYDYPLKMNGKRFDFYFEAKDIPPFGYKTFRLLTDKAVRRNTGSQVVDHNTMQNEHLRVRVNNNGTLDVTELHSGKTYSELFYFEDRGEVGGPCMPAPTVLDKVISSLGSQVQCSLIRDGADITTFQVDIDLKLPAKAVVDQGVYPFPKHFSFVTPWSRSEETIDYRITNYVTLTKGSHSVDVVVKVNNTAEDHRLRVMLPTGMTTDVINAEGQFDVLQRQIRHEDSSRYFEDIFHTQPHRYFLDVNDGENGLALITKGTHEYEFLDYENRTIAVTMLRCIRTGPEWRTNPMEKLSQCPGEHTFHFAICPHKGNWQKGDLYKETYRRHVPLRVVQMRKNDGVLPAKLSFLELHPTELVLSTIKLSESGDSVIVRFHNPTEAIIDGYLKSFIKLSSAQLVNLEEQLKKDLKVINEDRVNFSVGSRQIFTLKLFLKK